MQIDKKKESQTYLGQLSFSIVRVSRYAILCLFLLCLIHPVNANPDGWVSPTGHVPSGWIDEEYAYDDNEGTKATVWIPFLVTCDYLELTHDVLTCDKIRIWLDCDISWGTLNPIELDVHIDDAWVSLYNGAGSDYPYKDQWGTFEFDEGSVDALRVRATGINFLVTPQFRAIEADFWDIELPPPPPSGVEDFRTYIEVDTGSDRIQVSPTHIDFVSSRNAEETYVYKDFGENHFNIFTHKVDARLVSGTWLGCVWGLSNTVDELLDCQPILSVRFYGTTNLIYLTEKDSVGTQYDDSSNFTFIDGTWYYFTIEKNGTAFKAEIYSDSNRTIKLDTLQITLQTDYAFRYIYGCSSWTLTTVEIATLDIENLRLGEAQVYSFFFSETMNVSSSLKSWKAKMLYGSETVTVTSDSCVWKEKLFWFSESAIVTDALTVLKEKIMAFVEFLETIEPISEAIFIFPMTNMPVFFIGLMVVVSLIGFIFYLAYKKKKD